MSGSRPLRDLGLAITQLTVIPLRARWPSGERPDVASYYVWAGLLVGAVAYVPLKLLGAAHVDWGARAALTASLVLLEWAMFTRFMHWDGLADTADGWFGSDPNQRLQIAGDTTVGAFGTTSVVMFALVEFAALSAVLAGHELMVLVVPAFARFAATAAAWLGIAAKPSGLGASVVRKPSAAGLVSTAIGLLIAGTVTIGAYGSPGSVVAFAGLLAALVVPHLLARRFGGVTGDVMGASILVVEILLFVVAAVVV